MQVTELARRLLLGRLTRHPTRHEHIDPCLDVKVELLIDLLLDRRVRPRQTQQLPDSRAQLHGVFSPIVSIASISPLTYDGARSTLNTASAYIVHRVVSARSCARPRSVSW